MNLKATRGSYGDFGRVIRGTILKDVPKDQAAKLIKSGAYVEATAADLKAAEKAKTAETEKSKAQGKGKDALRDDGPTVAEYVAAGYLASNYPPEGYAARSTPEEIETAVKAEKSAQERVELEKLTNKQLQELAAAEGVEIEGDDNKASLVEKITAARAAKG